MIHAGNSTSFVGTLVRRQFKPGQQYVQLVFETTRGKRLSLSRNIRMIQSLRLNNAYRVLGEEYAIGTKRFTYEPTIVLLPYAHKKSRIMPYAALAGMASFVLIGLALVQVQLHVKPVKNATTPSPMISKESLPPVRSADAQVAPSTAPVTSAPVGTSDAKPKVKAVNQSAAVPGTATPSPSPVDVLPITPAEEPTLPTAPADDPIAPLPDQLPDVPPKDEVNSAPIETTNPGP